jgi:MFS family permease
MVAITAGIRPYQGHVMGWTNPRVLAALATGVVLLAVFLVVETRVENPMFDLHLFKIRAFSFGTLSSFLAALARGGLLFMLIIWLQGIWLPLHGFDYSKTPLWAGIAMMPLSLGILIAGPLSGYLSDRYGPRLFATGGMIATGLAFIFLDLLPINFAYPLFAAIIFLNGIGTGCFASPNRAAVMNSLPPQHRGAGSGMNTTFQNSAQVLSIGIFFSLMILGLSSVLSTSLVAGLRAHGVSTAVAERTAHLPPVSVLFAAFLGYNPIQHLLGAQALAQLPSSAAAQLSSQSFFPRLISSAFNSGLHEAFAFAVAACAIAAVASWSRGQRYVPELQGLEEPREEAAERPIRPG